LPLERVFELAEIAINAGAAAVSLGPPRGALPSSDGKLLRGRSYGPALFPLALATVQTLTKMGLLVIGACGVYQPEDIEAMLAAGALAVQLDSVIWRGNRLNCPIAGPAPRSSTIHRKVDRAITHSPPN
jgi:dihydroorotate dehydrogenase (NAD+) catalytic subunit